MQLKKIKLAGFKSFAEPTVVMFPSNLVAVVGPNGCGKSNIIDAVLWVMGESSARHLRGDLMVDVIFNGSASRKPVGKASVELLFDNSSGKVGGEYAGYNEIEMRREVGRDGVSTYYLNGSRCRRRDILGIFLGTGLGPRSYAIIEQGMISRLVEAKPDELRHFIEEAAGISKYKERRRETELRIVRTRENIARLDDVRGEVTTNLRRLEAQAKVARRYQSLQADQRRLDAELLALHWRDLASQVTTAKARVAEHETSVEAALAALRKLENTLEARREKLQKANEDAAEAQRCFYTVRATVSQIEQEIQHTNETLSAVEGDLSSAKQQLVDNEAHHRQDSERLQQLVGEEQAVELECETYDTERKAAEAALADAERAMQAWQVEWDTCNLATAERVRQEEVGATRLEYLQQNVEQTRQRRQQLREELDALDSLAVQATIGEIGQALDAATKKRETVLGRIDEQRQSLAVMCDEIEDVQTRINESAYEAQNIDGRLVSLEALQSAAYGHDQATLGAWLSRTGLTEYPKLAEQLEVEPAWLRAVEIVLQSYLHDIVVDNVEPLIDELTTLDDSNVGVIALYHGDKGTSERVGMVRLSEKIKATDALSAALSPVLDSVFVASDVAEAKRLRSELQRGESLITRDGLWLGECWSRVVRGHDDKSYVLTRQKEIDELSARRKALYNERATMDTDLDGKIEARNTLEQLLDEQQVTLQHHQETLSTARENLAAAEAQRDQIALRTQAIDKSLVNIDEGIDADLAEIVTVQESLRSLETEGADTHQQRLRDAKLQHSEALKVAKRGYQQADQDNHQAALRRGAINAERKSLMREIARSKRHVTELKKRCEDLEKTLGERRSALTAQRARRETDLQAMLANEKTLTQCRQSAASIEAELRDDERQKNIEEQRLAGVREILEGARLSLREDQVRADTVVNQLTEYGNDAKSLLATLPEDAACELWQHNLAKLKKKIDKLTPVNLAAIDEVAALSERKTYLDSQHQDLEAALTTLENAMRKIDQETRARFKETFDRINDKIGEKFPRLFGGGRAYLTLTDNNLLNTGVTIMARPPGKKNSTIQLLSGGEKALTAVALIFSIFELNPAPFCLLDEVDAPLDDENVQRYSAMVEAMSAEVQFIVVTHNKITMEVAHQLLGVTMQEAGVSRLVSVDVDEAVRMVSNA